MDRVVAEGAHQFMMVHFGGRLCAKILCDGVIEWNKCNSHN